MSSNVAALAVLAVSGAAVAQSTVTISGVLDAGYRSVNAPGVDADTSGGFQNGTATSAIIISGTEDLGGGMRALFRYEINPDFVAGSGFTGAALQNNDTIRTSNGANGYNFVGVSSAELGAVRFGRLNTASLAAWGVGSVFGTALGSGYGSNGNIFTRYSSSVANFNQTAPTRFNGAVEWTSPAINSFTARVLYVPQVDNVGGENNATVSTLAGSNRAGVTDIGLAYNKGPLNVQFAQQKHSYGANVVSAIANPGSNRAVNTDYTLNTVAANYTMGATTVYGAMWTEKAAATATNYAGGYNNAGNMIGVKHVMGATSLMASMGNSNDKATGGSNIDRKVAGLGVDYALSKRSNLWARYETRDANKNSAADTSAAGVTKTMAVGVRHTF